MATRRERIDFLVVGAQKAGTNAMRHYLSLHPSIGLPSVPEAHYFDSDQLFTSHAAHEEYHRYFPPARETMLRGEVTPIYMYWRPSMQRIWEYNPDIRLIALLRNPVERAYSHWNMETKQGARDSVVHHCVTWRACAPQSREATSRPRSLIHRQGLLYRADSEDVELLRRTTDALHQIGFARIRTARTASPGMRFSRHRGRISKRWRNPGL